MESWFLNLLTNCGSQYGDVSLDPTEGKKLLVLWEILFPRWGKSPGNFEMATTYSRSDDSTEIDQKNKSIGATKLLTVMSVKT